MLKKTPPEANHRANTGAASALGAEQYAIDLPWGLCHYTLKRSSRRSVGFVINDDGLQVSAPLRLAQAELERIIASKSTWINRRLQEWQTRQAQTVTLEWLLSQQQTIPVRGVPHTIENLPARSKPLVNPWTQVIALPEGPPEQRLANLEKALRHHAKDVFTHMAKQLAQRHQLPPHTLHLSSPKARWGSCNSQKQIRLNWRLVHHRPELIQYVIAHEMAHLLELNHSPRFWQVLASLMPGYKGPHHELSRLNPAEVPRPLA
ncbi:M48 family metallopeptidase [Limnobacter sp.]|uniref:M48 family metallopeptidase n=1 Tax=Limnobacter sp. TaxID=2003368 RepID=UPI00351458DC